VKNSVVNTLRHNRAKVNTFFSADEKKFTQIKNPRNVAKYWINIYRQGFSRPKKRFISSKILFVQAKKSFIETRKIVSTAGK